MNQTNRATPRVTLHASRCRTTTARARSRPQPAARSRRLTIRAAFEDQDAEAIRSKQVRVCARPIASTANRAARRVTLVVEQQAAARAVFALATQRRRAGPPRAIHARVSCASITLRARNAHPVVLDSGRGSRQWFAWDVGG